MKRCSRCDALIVFLKDETTGKWVPVTADCLTQGEWRMAGDRRNPIPYRPDLGHKNHNLTCSGRDVAPGRDFSEPSGA